MKKKRSVHNYVPHLTWFVNYCPSCHFSFYRADFLYIKYKQLSVPSLLGAKEPLPDDVNSSFCDGSGGTETVKPGTIEKAVASEEVPQEEQPEVENADEPKDPGNGVDSEVPPKEHHEVEHVKDLENPRKEDVPPKEEVETLEGSEEPVKDAMDEVPQEEVEPEHPRKDDREEVPPKEEVEPEDPRKEDREEVPPKEKVETEDVIEEEREVQPPKDDQEVEVSEEKPVEEPTHGVQSAKRKLEELEKPPLVLRCEQWAAKPVKPKAKSKATAKSAAKSAAKRSKRKQQDPVEIVDSEDEKQEPVEQEQKDVPKPKRKTRARVAKAAKVKDETEEQGEAKRLIHQSNISLSLPKENMIFKRHISGKKVRSHLKCLLRRLQPMVLIHQLFRSPSHLPGGLTPGLHQLKKGGLPSAILLTIISENGCSGMVCNAISLRRCWIKRVGSTIGLSKNDECQSWSIYTMHSHTSI